jgi:DNA-binding response OmpR family regulator
MRKEKVKIKSVLIVEDENKIRDIYKKLLTEEGYEVIETSNAGDAYDILCKREVDLVILDIQLPKIEGDRLHEVLRFFHYKSRVLVASVYPLETQVQLIPDADDYYDKSQGLDTLLVKIKKILM